MVSKAKIMEAISNNDIVVITGENQHQVLDILDGIYAPKVGKTVSTGAVLYRFQDKSVYVGDMPAHPTLSSAYRMEI